MAAHLTTVVQEAGKIFAALPLEVSKFNASKEKDAEVPQSIAYSTTEKSYGMVYKGGASISATTIRRPNWHPTLTAE